MTDLRPMSRIMRTPVHGGVAGVHHLRGNGDGWIGVYGGTPVHPSAGGPEGLTAATFDADGVLTGRSFTPGIYHQYVQPVRGTRYTVVVATPVVGGIPITVAGNAFVPAEDDTLLLLLDGATPVRSILMPVDPFSSSVRSFDVNSNGIMVVFRSSARIETFNLFTQSLISSATLSGYTSSDSVNVVIDDAGKVTMLVRPFTGGTVYTANSLTATTISSGNRVFYTGPGGASLAFSNVYLDSSTVSGTAFSQASSMCSYSDGSVGVYLHGGAVVHLSAGGTITTTSVPRTGTLIAQAFPPVGFDGGQRSIVVPVQGLGAVTVGSFTATPTPPYSSFIGGLSVDTLTGNVRSLIGAYVGGDSGLLIPIGSIIPPGPTGTGAIYGVSAKVPGLTPLTISIQASDSLVRSDFYPNTGSLRSYGISGYLNGGGWTVGYIPIA